MSDELTGSSRQTPREFAGTLCGRLAEQEPIVCCTCQSMVTGDAERVIEVSGIGGHDGDDCEIRLSWPADGSCGSRAVLRGTGGSTVWLAILEAWPGSFAEVA